MSAITTAEVRRLAKLANLAIPEADLERRARELDAIVGYVDQLSQVATDGVEPIANVAGLHTEGRPDVPGRMFTQAEALANAPSRNEVAFLVPKVVER
jgi:aspartyl-tRNA(Asn)/glutamyl-tRNA(Gln) amidotransferase subunit C